ncbi:MAG: DUF5752 family protein [Candidatus Binatia bacterium]
MAAKNGEAKNPFHFMACWELREMLGRRASDVQELLDGLEEAPLDSIYFHTHSYFLRHPYIAGPYPSDFANWAAIQVRDRVLGERLAVVDPFEIGDLEALRTELITILDDHLSNVGFVPRVTYGEPFYFMQSRILAVPTGVKARSLPEFTEVLERVDASSIYFHVFDAMARKGGRSDFQIWVEDGLGQSDLARRIARVNPYAASLEGVRGRVVELCRRELGA